MMKKFGPGGNPGLEGELLNSGFPTTDSTGLQVAQESSGFADFLVAQLKCASARARLIAVEIDGIEIALRGDFVTADDALNWLNECGGFGLITLPSSIAEPSP
jgi:uncharacterized Zn-binding protein involved in type VI secretion